jgi:C-terminal processing protease CtpA/Prc
MKKILTLLPLIGSLLYVASCDTKDTPDGDPGDFVSASFDPATQSFIVKYSTGVEESYSAIIDNSTQPPSAGYPLDEQTYLYVADATVEGEVTVSKEVNTVSQFVYDGLSLYYYWADEVVSKKPGINDVNPESYFYRILNSTDTEYGWSWITNDVEELLAGFKGNSTSGFGFQPFPLYESAGSPYIVGFIRYVYPGTPAEAAGLKRGEMIYKINGQRITLNNFMTLYGANRSTTFEVRDQNDENPREVTIIPANIQTDPVLYTNVYEAEGKKIGYLFYTHFYSDFNKSLYQAFSTFKSAGITDLVVDLRYNPGGDIGAANYLASLLAPASAVRNKEVYLKMTYNDYLNQIYDTNNWTRELSLGIYDSGTFEDPLSVNLNLDKVYIIATEYSASASELVTFCLEPFMEVEHIGSKTSGKYTASWTIHPYDDFDDNAQPLYVESSLSASDKDQLQNWAMQPIVGEYKNKEDDSFIATNGLIPDHPITLQERNTTSWKPIGDMDDYLFSKALSLITGRPYTAATRSFDHLQREDPKLYPPVEEIFRGSVIIDHPELKPISQHKR